MRQWRGKVRSGQGEGVAWKVRPGQGEGVAWKVKRRYVRKLRSEWNKCRYLQHTMLHYVCPTVDEYRLMDM